MQRARIGMRASDSNLDFDPLRSCSGGQDALIGHRNRSIPRSRVRLRRRRASHARCGCPLEHPPLGVSPRRAARFPSISGGPVVDPDADPAEPRSTTYRADCSKGGCELDSTRARSPSQRIVRTPVRIGAPIRASRWSARQRAGTGRSIPTQASEASRVGIQPRSASHSATRSPSPRASRTMIASPGSNDSRADHLGQLRSGSWLGNTSFAIGSCLERGPRYSASRAGRDDQRVPGEARSRSPPAPPARGRTSDTSRPRSPPAATARSGRRFRSKGSASQRTPPSRGFRSRSVTRWPARAASRADSMPATPPPTTTRFFRAGTPCVRRSISLPAWEFTAHRTLRPTQTSPTHR